MSELVKYRERMYKPTSRSDILHMLGNAVKVMAYEQIEGYSSLEDLLAPHNTVVLLYPNPQVDVNDDNAVGHWVCCFVIPGSDMLIYYDSFGCGIDAKVEEYNEEDINVRIHQRNRISPHLVKLILASPYADTTYWNHYPMQSDEVATATCGLWCVVRIKNNHLKEDSFKKVFLDIPLEAGILPDLLVSAMICNTYPEMCV